jgi:hypothetical protein
MDGVKTAERGYRRLEQDRLDWPTRPHHNSRFPIPDSRFWISEFRIPNSVWRMENLEYRTMKPWTRGDDPETDFGMIPARSQWM